MSATDPTAGEHRRVSNGPDSLDTCTGCDWASWDTAPSFADHAPAEPDAASEEARRRFLTEPVVRPAERAVVSHREEPDHPVYALPAEPDAGDVEAVQMLAGIRCQLLHDQIGGAWCVNCESWARRVAEPFWRPSLDAVRRKAGDERAEQIAQAIEAVADEHEAVMDARLPMPDRPERESGRKTVRRLRSIARESR